MMNSACQLLTTRELAIGYANGRRSPRVILEQLNLVAHQRELICVLGENGSGKTTLLRTLAGMNVPIAGELHIGGEPLPSLSQLELAKIRAIVLTDRINGAMLTGLDVVTLGRFPYTDWRGQVKDQDQEIVSQVLQWVGAQEFARELFDQLSDGQKQKILIARAMAQEPQLLLLDEPTAFLDLTRRIEIMLLLKELTRETGCTVIMATHDLDSALRVADCFWLIGGDGRVYCDIPEQLVLQGQLETAFSDSGLRFNYHSGSFEKDREFCPPIHVNGRGRVHEWTCRALKRLGYTIADHATQPDIPAVDIKRNDGEFQWKWQHRGNQYEAQEMAELLREITKDYPVAMKPN